VGKLGNSEKHLGNTKTKKLVFIMGNLKVFDSLKTSFVSATMFPQVGKQGKI
jgi:hypothetical protein